MAFFQKPAPVRNSSRFAIVVAGTAVPLNNHTLAALLEDEAQTDIEVIEMQHLPGEFAGQPPGA
jgi:hypothetical protein